MNIQRMGINAIVIIGKSHAERDVSELRDLKHIVHHKAPLNDITFDKSA